MISGLSSALGYVKGSAMISASDREWGPRRMARLVAAGRWPHHNTKVICAVIEGVIPVTG